jgi:hypothetical protein
MHNDYTRTGDTSKQGWSKDVKAWDDANIVAPSVEVRRCTTGDGAGGNVWINPENGPPETIIGKFVERTETAFASLPISVNDGRPSSATGCTDWKKRHARQYN